jgi:hypothetical protein
MRRAAAILVLVMTAGAALTALRIDISLADIDRALTIARDRESERARFHANYIKPIDTPFVERVEIISEFRRVVLMAEEYIARGDRLFAYSTTRADAALQVFRRRVAIRARIRFHPLNNYVTVPPVAVALVGNERALIGVSRDPVYGFSQEPDKAAPLMGAVVEGVFDADALGQAEREFVVSLDGKELGRFVFDFAAVE